MGNARIPVASSPSTPHELRHNQPSRASAAVTPGEREISKRGSNCGQFARAARVGGYLAYLAVMDLRHPPPIASRCIGLRVLRPLLIHFTPLLPVLEKIDLPLSSHRRRSSPTHTHRGKRNPKVRPQLFHSLIVICDKTYGASYEKYASVPSDTLQASSLFVFSDTDEKLVFFPN